MRHLVFILVLALAPSGVVVADDITLEAQIRECVQHRHYVPNGNGNAKDALKVFDQGWEKCNAIQDEWRKVMQAKDAAEIEKQKKPQ